MFKQGDKVICVKDCEKNSICAKKGQTGFVNGDLDILTRGVWVCSSLNNWKLINKQMKTLDNLEVGDLLNKGDYKFKVLAVLQELVAISYHSNHTTLNCWCTLTELKKNGYTLYQKPEVKELTVKEISEKLGYEVKIIKGNN